MLGPHETIGGHTVAPVSAEVWQAPEVTSNQSAGGKEITVASLITLAVVSLCALCIEIE